MREHSNERVPLTAPFESCVACFKGDVTTGLRFDGEPEAVIAALHVKFGIPEDQAVALVERYAADEYHCEPGTVPPYMEMPFVVCPECAAKAGLDVLGAGRIMRYAIPSIDEIERRKFWRYHDEDGGED